MPLLCPKCTKRTLEIESFLELPADSRSDEITVQVVGCRRCGFAGVAIYEESRRGALDREAVDHAGYNVDGEELRQLRKALDACPTPADSRCSCAVHREIGQQDANGRWSGLASIRLGERFTIEV